LIEGDVKMSTEDCSQAIDWTLLDSETLDQLIAAIQREVARYVPAGVSLVDELIAERRARANEE
jgi:hypothetical protein